MDLSLKALLTHPSYEMQLQTDVQGDILDRRPGRLILVLMYNHFRSTLANDLGVCDGMYERLQQF